MEFNWNLGFGIWDLNESVLRFALTFALCALSFALSIMITLTDKNFSEEVLKSQKVVLVDFWAEWCLPCKMMEPILEEIKNEFGDKIKIGKLNVDENPLIASSFMIDAIPALILFKDGKIVQRFTGVQAKEILEEAIKKAINEGD